MTEVAVVGSGPAGAFCALALIERGYKVTVLDSGRELDPERMALSESLVSTPREQWPVDVVRKLSANWTLDEPGVPRRLLFGSDFAYVRDNPLVPMENGGGFPAPTLAKGGYSIMWGGASLPAHDCDMHDWPISRADLEPHYREVLKVMPLTAGDGTLDEHFPVWSPEPGALTQSEQGEKLLADLERVGGRLRERGIIFGAARLAVHTRAGDGNSACVGCGFCLSGCPYGAIFSTRPLIERLSRHGQITYRDRIIVERIQEEANGVKVVFIDEGTRGRSCERFDGVFLGAGALNSTRILLHSAGLYGQAVVMKESLKFLLPMFRLSSGKGDLSGRYVTLSSAFIESLFQDLSSHWIHMQASPLNDMVLRRLGIDPWGSMSLKARILRPLLERLMFAWCGMHSNYGDDIVLTADAEGPEALARLKVDIRRKRDGRQLARRVSRRLARAALAFRTLIVPFPNFSDKIRGTHGGGTFPMRARPQAQFDSDPFGRPFGWERVFVVDSSVFPSIPGNTIAMNIMANAHRIGAKAPLECKGRD